MDSQSSAEELNQVVLPTVVPIVKETEPGITMDGLSIHAGHLSLLGWALHLTYIMLSAPLNYSETSYREGLELDAGDTMSTNKSAL